MMDTDRAMKLAASFGFEHGVTICAKLARNAAETVPAHISGREALIAFAGALEDANINHFKARGELPS